MTAEPRYTVPGNADYPCVYAQCRDSGITDVSRQIVLLTLGAAWKSHTRESDGIFVSRAWGLRLRQQCEPAKSR